MDIAKTQNELKQLGLDGWLLYDFRRTNDLACQVLGISVEALLTRRFYYWIPTTGMPLKLVHAIEEKALQHLPGERRCYRTWQELEKELKHLLQPAKKIAMEYSQSLPTISKVDGGTIDLVRHFGVEVVSSAPLLQHYSIWDEEKLRSHLVAAEALDSIAKETWEWIATKKHVSEYDVQQFMLERFAIYDCIADDPPICAVNAHSADPHYAPPKEGSSLITPGDFILIDLWCKKRGGVYADITRVAVVAKEPTKQQQNIFTTVRQAQEAATTLVRERFAKKLPLYGWEVDEAARTVIEKAGYGPYFIHRTGHNIDQRDHGPGANMDNFETHDDRQVLPRTCFSIEPGIYLPGEFGVRLEYDLFVHPDGRVEITGGEQTHIETLMHV